MTLPTLEEFVNWHPANSSKYQSLPREIYLIFSWAYDSSKYKEDLGIVIDWAVRYDNACRVANLLNQQKHFIADKIYGGRSRSPLWPAVRYAHLEQEPFCRACGRKDKLNVHHKIPYHIKPERELDPTNLITLCEGLTVNCHLLFGHLLNWSFFNVHVEEDSDKMRLKIKNR